MGKAGVNRNAIIQQIIDFYKLQPGISDDDLVKIEEYLLVMSSLVINTLEELEEVKNEDLQENFTDLFDALNSYVISVNDQMKKIFPDNNLNINPLFYDDKCMLHSIQIIEYLKNINQSAQNGIDLSEEIILLEEELYSDKFGLILCDALMNLVLQINSELIVLVEELV
ncbi:hypothetical protein ACT3CE_15935 [Marinifilum sp. RC60d5]|uniref:hypothetical protein n=1 Tax=Marinifilum sp. RC60d5 TaxID=3458414 RepID=UPI00403639B0